MTDHKQKIGSGGIGYQAEKLTVNNVAPRNKSIIAEVVNIISNIDFTESVIKSEVSLPAEITAKIQHNNIVKCRHIIESIKLNTIDLNNVYETLEEHRPGKKQKLLKIINFLYKSELGSLSQKEGLTIERIRENSDAIIENIIFELRKKVLESSNLEADNEDVDISIQLIVADAFIECLVLENPEASA